MKLKEGFEIKESNLEFKLDSEFVNLCNSLLDEELEKLESSIKVEGCRDPLVIWEEERILLDGHHRLYFCQQNKRPYQIYKKSFSDRFSALFWTWCNDKGRRGSGDSPYYDCETVILKFKEELEKRAKSQQGMRIDILTHGSKSIKPINVRKQLANLAHYSEMTINRTDFIMKYADEETKEGLRKRRPKLQFRALAEKYMMLYPEKQDSEEEKKFKETLDKETILNILNLPQAQSFVEAVKEVKNVTKEQQRKATKKIADKKDYSKEGIKKALLDEKFTGKKDNEEKHIIEFDDFIRECSRDIEKINRKIETLIKFKEEFQSNIYNKGLARFGFNAQLKILIENISNLTKEKNTDVRKLTN